MELTNTTFGIFYNLFNDLDLKQQVDREFGCDSSDNTLKRELVEQITVRNQAA